MVSSLIIRRAMLFAVTLVSCAALGSSQPVSCLEDMHCREGYFCETSAYVCHECLSCQDHKREPPRSPNSCIKSVGLCGPCLKGLVADPNGDLDCVQPTKGAAADGGASVGFWVGVGIGTALLLVAAAVLTYFAYKYFSSHSIIKVEMNTNMRLPLHMATAPPPPEGPPPAYSPANPMGDGPPPPDEDPLIKRYEPPFPAYESQSHQQVTGYNPPHYVRLYEMPPAARPEGLNDENDNYQTPSPPPQDERTTPSFWIPPPGYNDNRPPAARPEGLNDGNDSYQAPSPPPQDERTTPSFWIPPPGYNDNSAGATVKGTPAATGQEQRDRGDGDGAGNISTALNIARSTVLIRQPHAPIPNEELNANGAGAGAGAPTEEDSDDEGPYGANGASASFRMPRNRAIVSYKTCVVKFVDM